MKNKNILQLYIELQELTLKLIRQTVIKEFIKKIAANKDIMNHFGQRAFASTANFKKMLDVDYLDEFRRYTSNPFNDIVDAENIIDFSVSPGRLESYKTYYSIKLKLRNKIAIYIIDNHKYLLRLIRDYEFRYTRDFFYPKSNFMDEKSYDKEKKPIEQTLTNFFGDTNHLQNVVEVVGNWKI